jgi:hypothetical protein
LAIQKNRKLEGNLVVIAKIAEILVHSRYSGLFAILFWSPSLAADQQSEARALEALFAGQSSVEFADATWRQEINLTVDDCQITLQNEQRLPDQSAQRSYVETSFFDLRILDTKSDRVVSKPNQHTTYVSWHATPDVFRSALEMSKRLIEAGGKARQDLEQSKEQGTDRERTQALADMSERLWKDALASSDGDFLKFNHQVREAADRDDDPRRTFTPFLGFRLHMKPAAVSSAIATLDGYKASWCS